MRESLTIEETGRRYRPRRFKKLSRVNLLVGENGVGKSEVLKYLDYADEGCRRVNMSSPHLYHTQMTTEAMSGRNSELISEFVEAVDPTMTFGARGVEFRRGGEISSASFGVRSAAALGCAIPRLAPGGTLLIDEFASGIHHSAIAPLWELVFKHAKRLDAQVFATTHRLDVIVDLGRVIEDEGLGDEDAALHRLEFGRTDVVTYSSVQIRVICERWGDELRWHR